jgi:hypothetical protein
MIEITFQVVVFMVCDTSLKMERAYLSETLRYNNPDLDLKKHRCENHRTYKNNLPN